MIAPGDVPPSPIQIDAWVYGVVAIVLCVLMAVAMAMFISLVLGIWERITRR